ncbi:hypothetical protein Tco_1056580 [Tanacetum coccineum]|uniref:Uncharacterized protein n=1 Tax=Tanacetum coccineum TaxID=301880 RepID=A0ABQ5H574_9ASTR
MCLPELQQTTLKPSFRRHECMMLYGRAPLMGDAKALEKVLVREEVIKFVTKYANAISLIRIEDDADKECGDFIDKEAVEQIKVAEKEKVVEDVEDNESDRSMNEDSTIWDKYVDKLT